VRVGRCFTGLGDGGIPRRLSRQPPIRIPHSQASRDYSCAPSRPAGSPMAKPSTPQQ
jgi:hypothetical protein